MFELKECVNFLKEHGLDTLLLFVLCEVLFYLNLNLRDLAVSDISRGICNLMDNPLLFVSLTIFVLFHISLL